eukprot:589442-Pelagomonas_calceolata.AAC.1
MARLGVSSLDLVQLHWENFEQQGTEVRECWKCGAVKLGRLIQNLEQGRAVVRECWKWCSCAGRNLVQQRAEVRECWKWCSCTGRILVQQRAEVRVYSTHHPLFELLHHHRFY